MMAEKVLKDLPLKQGDAVIAMLNGMGGTPLIELYVIYNELSQLCQKHGITLPQAESAIILHP